MQTETCWTLIRSAAAGDREQREEFSRRYEPMVKAVLAARWKATSLQDEVVDAAQEVFAACFKAGGALARAEGARKGFRSFLFGVIRNIALTMERAHARRIARVKPADVPEAVADETDLAALFDREYARTLVHETVETMALRAEALGEGARQRVALVRTRMEDDAPMREIARLWNADPKTLHQEWAKAGREFRSAMRQVVGLSECCAVEHLDRECERLLDLLH